MSTNNDKVYVSSYPSWPDEPVAPVALPKPAPPPPRVPGPIERLARKKVKELLTWVMIVVICTGIGLFAGPIVGVVAALLMAWPDKVKT